MSMFGGLFGDFYRERAAILVTSAEMSQINHGYVEMFYPEALFWHHKVNRIHPNEKLGTMGFLSLNEKLFDSPSNPRIQLSFTGSSENATYQIPTAELQNLMKGVIPSNYFVYGTSGPVESIEVKTAVDMKDGEIFIPLVEGKWVEEPKAANQPADQKPTRNLVFPPSKMAYMVNVGPRSKLLEKFDQYKKGFEGDKEAGIAVHGSMYRTRSLTFEIAPSAAYGDDPAKVGAGISLVKGWYVARHYLQPFGHMVLPVIQSEQKRISPASEVSRRLSSDFSAPHVVLNEKGEVTEFAMDATAFIQNVFVPKVKPGSMVEASDYECLVNPNHPEDSACRIEPGTDGKPQAIVRIKFAGPDNQKQRDENSFFIWDGKAQGDFHRVTVLANLEPTSPSGKNVPPLRLRASETKAEDLK